MITWSLASGVVAFECEDHALVPHIIFLVLTQSNAALLLILLSALMHSQLTGIVMSNHLLHGLTREALRVFSNTWNCDVQSSRCTNTYPENCYIYMMTLQLVQPLHTLLHIFTIFSCFSLVLVG